MVISLVPNLRCHVINLKHLNKITVPTILFDSKVFFISCLGFDFHSKAIPKSINLKLSGEGFYVQ